MAAGLLKARAFPRVGLGRRCAPGCPGKHPRASARRGCAAVSWGAASCACACVCVCVCVCGWRAGGGGGGKRCGSRLLVHLGPRGVQSRTLGSRRAKNTFFRFHPSALPGFATQKVLFSVFPLVDPRSTNFGRIIYIDLFFDMTLFPLVRPVKNIFFRFHPSRPPVDKFRPDHI